MVAASFGSNATRATNRPEQIARDIGQRERAKRVRRQQNPPARGDDHIVVVGRSDVHFARGPRNRHLLGPRRPAGRAVPEVRVARRIHAAVGAWIDRNGRKVNVGLRRRKWWRDVCPASPVGSWSGRCWRCSSRRPSSGSARHARRRNRRRRSHPSSSGKRAGRRIGDDAIVLQRAEGHARRRIPLDVETVEQGGLQAASVERREGGAAGAIEDPTVIAAIDDRERTRLRRERPRVRVGVQSAQRP